MKVTVLNKKGNKKLILFFNGWGMDYRAISHLPSNDFDIIILNEYHDLTFDSSIILKYENIYVVAWSLGVWVANCFLLSNNSKITKIIAINGTVQPIDSLNGIAEDTFQGTIDFWNETNRTKFQMRMFKDRKLFTNNINKLPIRTLSEQKVELEMLQKNICTHNDTLVNWDKVFIGSDDLIFTTENQLRFWNNNALVSELQMPHYPFLMLDSWEKILS